MLTKLSSWFKLTIIIPLFVVPVVLWVKKPKNSLVFPVSDIANLPTVLPTVSISPTASPTAALISSPTASLMIKPGMAPKNFYSLEEIQDLLKEYSDKHDIDINYLRHIVDCESSFDSLASNLTYAGLFQFDSRTWITYRELTNEDSDPSLRFDAREAIRTATYLISIGKTDLWPNCIP